MESEGPPAQKRATLLERLVFGKNPSWTIARIAFVVVASIILFKFVLVPIRVTGNSMFPTYKNGEIKFVNKLGYMRSDPKRGDVIAAVFEGEVLLLKRIVGLPGELFQVYAGDLYINGNKLDEPYAHGKVTVPPPKKGAPPRVGSTEPIPLGPDEYMIIGDNRPDSEGYIKERHEIIGPVL